jgi:hypothetical protein
MLEAQNPVSSITLNFRSSSFFISPLSKSTDTSLNTSSPLLLLVPDTASEIFFKNAIQGSGVAQQSIELSPHLLFPLQISLTETLDRYTTVVIPKNDTNQTTTESQLSLPLFVSLQGSPCPPSGQSCQLTARLQNNRIQSSLQESRNFITSSKSSPLNSTRSYFEIDCVAGVAEDHYFRCPSGALMLISCNGSSTLRGRKHCPNISSTVLCRTKVQAATSAYSSEIDCELAEYNSTITICVCNLSRIGVLGHQGAVTFSILSVQKSVIGEFVSTWETVPSLSSGTVAESWVVLLTVGGLGGIFFLMVA